MNLIEILKGARKRIEAAEYLPCGSYHEDDITYGNCYCAVGHILKEMNVDNKDIHLLEGCYIDDIDVEFLTEQEEPIADIVGSLQEHEDIIRELQNANDDSERDERKANVLAKLDEIISKLEGEQQ